MPRIRDVFGQGDKLVKHWNFKGTHTGEFFGIPATGRNVDTDSVTLVRMKDGKIVEERDFFDNLELSPQLERIPASVPSQPRPRAFHGSFPEVKLWGLPPDHRANGAHCPTAFD